ncbi:MAG: SDR family oxidoreductase [Chloroflexota bacterium]
MARFKLPKKLQGQVAIITGGGRGIGEATAYQLAQSGAALVLAARSVSQADAVAKKIRQGGGRAIGVEADISDPMQVEEVVESALDQYNRVDMLLNNAGLVWPIEETIDSDPDEWAYSIHVNLIGAFYLIRNVLPLMKAQNYGRIVNVGSGAGQTPIAGMSAYCASKAGLEMMTKVIAQEVIGSNITINYLIPGMVDTEMQSDIRSVDTSETSLDYSHWHNQFEKKRLLDPAEVALYVSWLFGPWCQGRSGEIFQIHDPKWQEQVAADFGI